MTDNFLILMTTVRFSQVVAACGTPEPYTLWMDPVNDANFQKLLKHNRVMTVHQQTVGAKKDFGEIGYAGGRDANLLIFPKALSSFVGKRIVGVKYDLLQPLETDEPAKPRAEATPAPKAQPVPEPKRKPAAAASPHLHIFRPEAAEASPVKRASKKSVPHDAAPPASPQKLEHLRHEVRKAMTALEQGKAVAAYQLLEKALQ